VVEEVEKKAVSMMPPFFIDAFGLGYFPKRNIRLLLGGCFFFGMQNY
jgi:hypothetical protein